MALQNPTLIKFYFLTVAMDYIMPLKKPEPQCDCIWREGFQEGMKVKEGYEGGALIR